MKQHRNDVEDEDNSELHDERDCHSNEPEEDSPEDLQINEREDNEPRRGVGRPKIIRTGKPGRPRKMYQSSDVQQADPKSVSQMLKHDDKED